MDLPTGLIAVRAPKDVSLLTPAEYVRGLKPGKWWKRTQAATKREAEALPKKHHERRERPTLIGACVSKRVGGKWHRS